MNLPRHFGIVFLSCLLSVIAARAQLSPRLQHLCSITFDHITEGLPSGSVQAIAEDSRGFMWFGCQNGLCRYDGYTMLVFKKNELDSTSLADSFVLGGAILADSSGKSIWVGGRYGLSAYNVSTCTFTRFTPDSADPYSLSNEYATSLYQEPSGTIWIGTGEGLNALTRDSTGHARFMRYTMEPNDAESLGGIGILALCGADDGTLWVGTNRGLRRFDARTKRVTRVYLTGSDAHDRDADVVCTLCRDREGILWVGTLGGLVKYDSRSGSITRIRHDPKNPYTPSGNLVSSLALDEDGILWIGTMDGGLSALDTETGQSIRFPQDPVKSAPMSNDEVKCVFLDRTGSVWVGTNGGGIYIYKRGKNHCIHLRKEPGKSNSLSGDDVLQMAEDKNGAVWIGTGGGLDAYDRRTGTFRHYHHDPFNDRSLSFPWVLSVFSDRDGAIWAAGYEGLTRIDPRTGSISRHYAEPAPPHNVHSNSISGIHRTPTGVLCVATSAGPKIVNLRERRFDDLPYHVFSTQILGDRDGRTLWVASDGDGLVQIDLNTRQVRKFSNNPHDSTSISHNSALALCEDVSQPERILWVCTYGGGLNRFDKYTGTFKRFTETDGLADNGIIAMAFDNRGRLWLGTDKGLSRFDPRTEVFRNYDSRDGIIDGGAGEHSLLRVSTGEMFAGSRGLTIFHPDSLRDNTHIPPIVLTDFRITNRSVRPGEPGSPLRESITETREIVLSHLDNMISFEFAALDYVMPEKNHYAYMLEGFDKEWIYAGTVRTATYTNLDPGKYVFRVKGSNNDGIWNEEGAFLSIIITPPWWETAWAYVGYVVIIGTLLYSVYRIRVNRLRLVHRLQLEHVEAEKMHELDHLKSRFFANISHEFRTPLTLILGPARQLLEGSTDEQTKTNADLIHRSARKLNRLVDELLDLARIEAGQMKLNARPVNIVSAVQDVVLTFQPLAERKRITCRCACDENEILAYLDKEKADKIFTNVLSNAFKFTPDGGTVDVRVTRSTARPLSGPPEGATRGGETVTVAVSDTGVGISRDHLEKIFDRFYQVDGSHTREQEGTGIGLALTKELVELHKGKIEVESEEGKGSTFRLIFPLGRTHLTPEEIGEEDRGGAQEARIAQSDEAFEQTAEPEEVHDLAGTPALPTLLVVEDNADVRKYIRSILDNTYRILEARDGEEGLEKSLECVPELIITDIMMPKMDGIQLCGKLKGDWKTSHIPVIMLTAKATMRDKIEGLETGADDYIMKPFEARELEARIRNLIEQRKRLHEHFRAYGLVDLPETNITSLDQKFLRKAMEVVNEHIADTSFSVEVFAEKMTMSRSLLFRKMESLIGEPPSELVKRTRLDRAARLIAAKAGNISEIALEVGFSNPSRFAESFRKRFGCTPTQYHNHSQNLPSGQAPSEAN